MIKSWTWKVFSEVTSKKYVKIKIVEITLSNGLCELFHNLITVE